MELDASINSCRRLNETLFLITYPLSTSLYAISAASKHIHSMVAPYCFKGQGLQVANVDSDVDSKILNLYFLVYKQCLK